jgi:6-phosphogluconolactonase (cycloisomerase 2 family)
MRPLTRIVLVSSILLSVLPADGAVNPFRPVSSLPTNTSPRGVAVGNVFGDGIPSFIVANFGSPTFIGQSTAATLLTPQNSNLQVFSLSPEGLDLKATIPTASSPRGLCTFDVNGSGLQDIVVTAYDAGQVQIFGWQNGQFVQVDEQPTLKMPVGVAMGWSRGNGAGLLAVADYGANSLSLFEVKNGKLGKRFDVPVDNGPTQVAIGDLKGDGGNEIAVVCLLANKIDILSQSPNGINEDLSSYRVTQVLNLPDGSMPADVKIADLNGDGKADLVTADFGTNAISVFLQQNDGTLLAQPTLSTSGSHPNGLTVGDLYKDGKREIIVANRDSDTIDVFQMNANQFQLVQTLKVSNDPETSFGPVEVGLVDAGNGKVDLVASHMRSNSIRVLTEDLPQPTPTPAGAGVSGEGNFFSGATVYCYPNLTHDGNVAIHFSLATPLPISIQIFDMVGDLVWSKGLGPSQTQTGANVVDWQGVNQNGRSLASGLYLCSIHAGNQTVTKKIAIIR